MSLESVSFPFRRAISGEKGRHFVPARLHRCVELVPLRGTALLHPTFLPGNGVQINFAIERLITAHPKKVGRRLRPGGRPSESGH